jgi:hypothetical protein
MRAHPSHLFRRLPIMHSGDLPGWLICILLHALKYAKEGDKMFSRININRISSMKLIGLIIEHYQPHNKQITYFIESLCLQTRPEQI